MNWNHEIHKYLKYMENVKSASTHTLKAYKNDLLLTFHEASSHLSDAELISYIRSHQTQWARFSLATRNRRTATLKSFLNWMFEQGKIQRQLSTQIHGPKVPQKIPHFISADEAVSVLKSYSSHFSQRELIDKSLFCLLYGAGLRVSEACHLEWKNVDFKNRQIKVIRKGRKEQWVPIPRITSETLQELRKHCFDHFVFGEKPMNPREAYEIVRRRGMKANLAKPLHPHALRHSFATHLLTSGADIRVLQELMGHQSLVATQKYLHLSLHDLAETVEAHHPLELGKSKGD